MSESERFEHWFEHEANVRMSDLPENEAWYVWQARARIAEQREAELVGVLKRYRDETPLGHQPHMIAGEVDAILAKYKCGGPR